MRLMCGTQGRHDTAARLMEEGKRRRSKWPQPMEKKACLGLHPTEKLNKPVEWETSSTGEAPNMPCTIE